MAHPLKNIAVVGASGTIGSIILDGLVASKQFKITAISRKDSEKTFPAGVAVHKTDFSDTGLEAAFGGQDVVISALGAAGFGEQKKLVDAAVRAGVKRFLPSEFSANTLSPAVLQLLPLFGQKKEVIEYLKTKESEGLTWTGLCTSGLFDWGLRNGFLGFDIANRTASIWDSGDKSFTMTNETQLKEAVVSVLQHPAETANKYMYVASVETTHNEIVAALEEATGAKWTVNKTTTEAEVGEAFKKLGAGDFGGALTLVRATSCGNTPGLRSDYAKEETLSNDLLGLKLESVKDIAERVVSESS